MKNRKREIENRISKNNEEIPTLEKEIEDLKKESPLVAKKQEELKREKTRVGGIGRREKEIIFSEN